MRSRSADSPSTCQLFYDYEPQGTRTVAKPLPRRLYGHKLLVGEGTHAEPNLQFEMDALRFSKGVLNPSQFLCRAPGGFVLFVR